MICPICKSKKIKEIFSKFPGYTENTSYEIYDCSSCNTQFIPTKNLNMEIYDIIYAQDNTPGYDRYYRYAKEIKDQKNPLKFLSMEESSYYPVYQLIKKYKKLKILEIGCGYGYLTYALHQMGHSIIGIDISKNAIKFAKSNFGKYFSLSSIDILNINEKFDMIVATELIEHIENPVEFINICTDLLNKNGRIILTTPNKDYAPSKSIWKTDLPPVHTVWLSKKSFEYIAKQNNLSCTFVNFSKYISNKENKLITYFLSRISQSNLPIPVLDKKGAPYHKRVAISNSIFIKIIKKTMFSSLIKYASHFCAKLINFESQTLGIVLSKK